MAPVLLIVRLPPPVCEIPLIPNAPVFVNATLPLVVFVALKVARTFAPFNVCPPTDEVVNVPLPFINPAPLSAIVLFDVNDVVPAPSANVPVMLIAPVLPTMTLPPPVCEILASVKGAAVFVNAMFPLVVFVALKIEITFAPFNV